MVSRKSSGSLRPSSASQISTQDFSDRPISRRIVSSGDQSSPCARSARERLALASGSVSTSTPSQSKITSKNGLLRVVGPKEPTSEWFVAGHCNPVSAARMRPVVPHGAMLDAAVVPEGNGVLAPAEAALEQRVLHVLVEI